jgi:hypothetical protein
MVCACAIERGIVAVVYRDIDATIAPELLIWIVAMSLDSLEDFVIAARAAELTYKDNTEWRRTGWRCLYKAETW